MKVQLCLLSDQHVPNLISVHHFKPDHLVLIETTQMKTKQASKHFLKALEVGGCNYETRCDVESLKDEDNLTEIRKTLQAAYQKHSNDEWIANLTGGTKPMSIATYDFFKQKGGRMVYTNSSRPAKLLEIDTGQSENSDYKPSIKAFLAGYGFVSLKADDKLKESICRAIKRTHIARLLAQSIENDKVFLSFKNNEERKRAREKGTSLSEEQCDCEEIRNIWLKEGGTETLDKYDVQFLTGGWLEVFMWDVLSKHQKELGIWDVMLGLQVQRDGRESSDNELDVVFMRNHGLSIIECKSGTQEQDKDGDVLYKLEAIKKDFGALHVRSYLATTARNILENNTLKKSVKTRADNYNCRILTHDQIRELAKSADSFDLVNRIIFG